MSGNGQLTPGELTTVQGSIQLSNKTAVAWARARAENPRLAIATPAGGYRSLAVQRDMKARPWAYNLNPESGAALAAVGHSSHGYGTAVDVVGDLHWFIQNGSRFGFSRPLWNDPNHFVHNGVTATQGTASFLREDNTQMRLILHPTNKWPDGRPIYYMVGNGVPYRLDCTGAEASALADGLPVTLQPKTAAEWDRWIGLLTPPLQPGHGGSGEVPAGVATQADLAAMEARLKDEIPPAVIVEQKKPGN